VILACAVPRRVWPARPGRVCDACWCITVQSIQHLAAMFIVSARSRALMFDTNERIRRRGYSLCVFRRHHPVLLLTVVSGALSVVSYFVRMPVSTFVLSALSLNREFMSDGFKVCKQNC